MIKIIKILLYKSISLKGYLKAMHRGFFLMFDIGALRKDYIYKYHYFVKHLINKGDCVVDIGANLGYYTGIFSRLVGSAGKVIAFEPMPPFFGVLQWAFNKKKNVVLYNYALGTEDKTTEIFQSNADSSYFRTGLPNIITEEEGLQKGPGTTYTIQMRRGSAVLGQLNKIDYIKVDIEGFEEFVMPELTPVLQKHKPIVQIETWEPQKTVVFRLLHDLGYACYSLYRGKLVKDFDNAVETGDFLFFHSSQEEALLAKMKLLNYV